MFQILLGRITIAVLCGFMSCLAKATAQDFIKDYRLHIVNIAGKQHSVTKKIRGPVERLQEAFKEYSRLTRNKILNSDTLYMVHSFNIESGKYTNVIWNRNYSFLYQYQFQWPLKVNLDASQWINGYKPEFKRWVETADTAKYGKYGRQTSWFDAPSISFTVATKRNKRWYFVTSGSYSNNIDQLK